MKVLNYIVLVCMVLALVFYIGSKSKPYQIITGKSMGAFYSVKLRSNSENALLNNEIKEILEDISQRFSVFDSSSEISKINKNTTDEWIELSPDMSDALVKSYNAYKLSNGAFDPTIGLLIDLWGFGEAQVSKTPTEDEVKSMLLYTGFNKIRFTNDFTKIKKSNPNIHLNLSAIAKGYAVDKVAEFLESKGYQDYVVQIGGEIRVKGQKSQEIDGWNVAVVKPIRDQHENAFILVLKNISVATSGDYRSFFDYNGEMLSHTIDSQTGYPVKSNIVSVTVFDENCVTADAMATALQSMGEKKAQKFANDKKLKVIMFTKRNTNDLEIFVSDAAKELVKTDLQKDGRI